MTLQKSKKSLTYQDAGVSIDAGNKVVDSIKDLAASTHRLGAVQSIGGFGGIFDFKKLGYQDPLLVSGTDGVGTKLKIAQAMNKHTTIGIDLVAMCVNDIITQGAEPLFFLDYLATGKLEVHQAKEIIAGIVDGCKQSNCTLLGGETAEMPGMYQGSDYDLAGFVVGMVERTALLPKKEHIKHGDTIVGIASAGLHATGFSLVRHIIASQGLSLHDTPPFASDYNTLGDALLEPTKLYVKSLLPLVKEKKIKALAHITGGGLLENVPRVLPKDLYADFDTSAWPHPPVFTWLQSMGISEKEMMRTFNRGIGMVAIVESHDAESLITQLEEAGEKAYRIGVIKKKEA